MELGQEAGRQEGDGRLAFLRQAYRNNWQRYLASLAGEGAQRAVRAVSGVCDELPAPGIEMAQGGWDRCILTASDDRQAAMYERQLALRRAAGLLPARTRFEVVADPPGRRIGSGGATLRVMARLAGAGRKEEEASHEPPLRQAYEEREEQVARAPAGPGGPPLPWAAFPEERVLVIHSGGDSRRLPHCSAAGKLFARVPRVLPDGRASTLFDEFLISLSGVARRLPPGVLVASGDVLLLFDHLQLDLHWPGVIGVAIAAPAETGTQHGVYVLEGQRSGRRAAQLRAYLHKPPLDRLRTWDAIAADGTVPVDTGLVWFDAPTAASLVDLAGAGALAPYCGDGGPPRAAGLNLYGDLLMPLVPSTTRDGYMADTSDGPLSGELQAARAAIWEQVRGMRFSVQRLQPAVFAHFGTTREYWAMITAAPEWARATGWTAQAASWQGGRREHAGAFSTAVLLNAAVEGKIAAEAATTSGKMMAGAVTPDEGSHPGANVGPVLVVDSWLRGPLVAGGEALVAGVRAEDGLALEAGSVLHQLPIEGGGYVTRIYGLDDDPKQVWDSPAGAFLNRPWAPWLVGKGIEPGAVWPDVPLGERTLWNARLYPLVSDREESLALSLALASPGEVPGGWRERWLGCERLSLEESYRRADCGRLLADIQVVEDIVAACCFHEAIVEERPAAEAARLLGSRAEVTARRAGCVAERVAAHDAVTQLRGYEALAVATGDGRWEEQAFAVLREMIESAVEKSPSLSSPRRAEGLEEGRVRRVRVASAARIDFGGGWTDTPPYSIECGGVVLNAAITLHGVHPIVAEAERLTEPALVLESGDIDATMSLQRVGEVLDYANPADPFALLKAAAVLCGLVPRDARPDVPLAALLAEAGGVRICTQTSIPRGSGLGTSSILAGAVLVCLGRLVGCMPTEAQLFGQVLCLEQMMTTGGGWQDQVGGLTGGIKLVTSEPGLPQRVRVAPLVLSAETETALRARLLLVYTGQQRLAKNLLQAVMGRWMARDPEMVWIQGEIARLAVAMRDALVAGDVDAFGALLSEHWTLNKRMDAGCTNEFINGLFADMDPYICGGKLAGAGGGGFAIVVARDEGAVGALEARLRERYAAAGVAVWPSAVPEVAIAVQVDCE